MNTAKWALLAQQTALEITGQNIANVNNPDYNRQEVFLEAQTPVNEGRYFIGTGVRVAGVERRFDRYIFSQRLESNSLFSGWGARELGMGRIESILNESGESGISAGIAELFQAFYDLSTDPSGMAQRSDITEKAKSLAGMVSYAAAELQNTRRDTDWQITGKIPEINNITEQIAQLNKLIHETETNGAVANDYRDSREALLMKLSGIVDISYFEQSNKEIVVVMNGGRSLVVGQSSFTLSTRTNSLDPQVSDIMWADAGGNQTDITSEFTGGSLGAWIELRDIDLPGILNNLNTLAASIVKEVNRLHSSGYGLDGSTGVDFFTQLTPGGKASTLNVGTGVLGAGTVTNPEIVDLDRYRITFDGAGNYSVFNIDENAASGTYTFSSGTPLSFFQQRGFDISITGAPSASDSFEISASDNAAFNMSVSAQVQNNPSSIAAGTTTNSGDGEIARRIADLQYGRTIGGYFGAASGLFTFDDFLGSLVGEIGSQAQAAQSGRALQESTDNQLSNLREQVSGVSLDEETINLIKYQSAYEAAAKMISVIDEMLQTLLSLK